MCKHTEQQRFIFVNGRKVGGSGLYDLDLLYKTGVYTKYNLVLLYLRGGNEETVLQPR